MEGGLGAFDKSRSEDRVVQVCFRLFKAFFSKIVSKVIGSTKNARIRSLSKKSFIDQLVMEDHVGGKDELIMPGSVIVRPRGIGVVIAQLGPDGDEFVWPPGNADGVLRVLGGKAGPAAHLVVHVFVADREERIPGNPKHGVIDDRPLRRVTIAYGK